MKERRAEPRLWCSDLIRVRVEGERPRELTGNLEDISASGACVLFEEPVPPGTRVCLKLGRHRFPGEVRHSTHHQIGYFVGIRFEAGTVWSREIYLPKHMLDPREVAARGSGSKSGA